jgi:hypothetical protein
MENGQRIAELVEKNGDAIAIRMLVDNDDFADELDLWYQRAQQSR